MERLPCLVSACSCITPDGEKHRAPVVGKARALLAEGGAIVSGERSTDKQRAPTPREAGPCCRAMKGMVHATSLSWHASKADGSLTEGAKDVTGPALVEKSSIWRAVARRSKDVSEAGGGSR